MLGPNSYHSVPAGELKAQDNAWEIIGWGYDCEGVPRAAVFETKAKSGTTESLDIVSRSDKGPSAVTLGMIRETVRGLQNQRLGVLERGLIRTVQDGERNGMGWPGCNETCRSNGELPCPHSQRKLKRGRQEAAYSLPLPDP
jgi:hypothetical protein